MITQVALVFLALAAVATAASYGGYKHVDYVGFSKNLLPVMLIETYSFSL